MCNKNFINLCLLFICSTFPLRAAAKANYWTTPLRILIKRWNCWTLRRVPQQTPLFSPSPRFELHNLQRSKINLYGVHLSQHTRGFSTFLYKFVLNIPGIPVNGLVQLFIWYVSVVGMVVVVVGSPFTDASLFRCGIQSCSRAAGAAVALLRLM